MHINWHNFLFGEESWNFLPEVILRSMLMFIVAIIAVRLIGKRGIMQGVFEIVTIVTLGSAAGDPMFYSNVGVLPAIFVFIAITGMYKLTDFFIKRFKWLERAIEGRCVKLIRDRQFAVENFSREDLGKDLLLADLRMEGVLHLGQVDVAYIESSGRMSVFFLPDEKVDYGLPMLPELYDKQYSVIPDSGIYACAYCGMTVHLEAAQKKTCLCREDKWVKAINVLRVK